MKHSLVAVLCLFGLLPIACATRGSPTALLPYSDVRNKDLQNQAAYLDEELLQTFWFNESTIWPSRFCSIAKRLLESGKNPGLGIRALHNQGVTGRGVRVAIIDQNICLDNPEYGASIFQVLRRWYQSTC
jgi:serine protease AprX